MLSVSNLKIYLLVEIPVKFGIIVSDIIKFCWKIDIAIGIGVVKCISVKKLKILYFCFCYRTLRLALK